MAERIRSLPVGLTATPDTSTALVTDDFPSAYERLALLCERDRGHIAYFGRTIALLQTRDGTPVRTQRSAVLYHGLTLSPMQFQRVAEELYAQGYTVIVPRLPHHGHANRLTNALAYLNIDELKAFAKETLALARCFGEQVTVAGFSLGGLLAAWIGQYEPVERIVAISPSLDLGIVPSGLSRYVTTAMLRYPNFSYWINPIQRQRRPPEHTYPRYSSHALAHIYFFGQELFEAARISAPRAKHITIVTNKHDLTISNAATAKLIDLWRGKRDGDIETYEFADLPISHDIIDPLRHHWIAERVHPKLLELLD